ncbi:MAG: 6-phosphogluconolactonase [Candidatus Omnitrophica bacterium]|nr:6-phosphogluconolactonase [Candidatus Omnitrophota bacterium]
MKKEILIFENIVMMSESIINRWKQIAKEAITNRGCFSIVLSGGKTPVDLYQRLAKLNGDEIPWEKTHVFFIDERYVGPDHPHNNMAMLSVELFEKNMMPKENIYPIFDQGITLERAADIYAGKIRNFFNLRELEYPVFDLILLGLGADGHTAALFPKDMPSILKEKRLVAKVEVQDAKEPWITMTLPVINSARSIFVLVSGSHKADIFKKVIEENADLPAAKIMPKNGKLIFCVDKQAASSLPEKYNSL